MIAPWVFWDQECKWRGNMFINIICSSRSRKPVRHWWLEYSISDSEIVSFVILVLWAGIVFILNVTYPCILSSTLLFFCEWWNEQQLLRLWRRLFVYVISRYYPGYVILDDGCYFHLKILQGTIGLLCFWGGWTRGKFLIFKFFQDSPQLGEFGGSDISCWPLVWTNDGSSCIFGDWGFWFLRLWFSRRSFGYLCFDFLLVSYVQRC